MSTKLTLRLDEKLIESAKEYSNRTGKSLSRIVSDLFEIIRNEKLGKEPEITPVTASLKGALKGKNISEEDYKKHLEEKYQ
ncbi:MAG: antitoxin [Gammaproteobacteria bacterium]|nr:MAG: antitoxin [Gammaproteobacteria bacterium]